MNRVKSLLTSFKCTTTSITVYIIIVILKIQRLLEKASKATWMENAKAPFSGEENTISYLIFSEFNVHIFNMAVWKCVKQYVTYHPHKETYNPCLTTNCNHRKEKSNTSFHQHMFASCHTPMSYVAYADQVAHICVLQLL